jgi:hypothetical protein
MWIKSVEKYIFVDKKHNQYNIISNKNLILK